MAPPTDRHGKLIPVERYKQCRKCGHINEHRLRFKGSLGGSGVIMAECQVCYFEEAVHCADDNGQSLCQDPRVRGLRQEEGPAPGQ